MNIQVTNAPSTRYFLSSRDVINSIPEIRKRKEAQSDAGDRRKADRDGKQGSQPGTDSSAIDIRS